MREPLGPTHVSQNTLRHRYYDASQNTRVYTMQLITAECPTKLACWHQRNEQKKVRALHSTADIPQGRQEQIKAWQGELR